MSCGKDWEILQREYVYLFSAEANLKIVTYAIIKSNPTIKPNFGLPRPEESHYVVIIISVESDLGSCWCFYSHDL